MALAVCVAALVLALAAVGVRLGLEAYYRRAYPLGYQGLIDAAIETRFDLSVRNYAVVSFGIVRDRQSGREAVASIALFGTVVPLTDAILKIAAPRQPADTLASPADTLVSPAATTP